MHWGSGQKWAGGFMGQKGKLVGWKSPSVLCSPAISKSLSVATREVETLTLAGSTSTPRTTASVHSSSTFLLGVFQATWGCLVFNSSMPITLSSFLLTWWFLSVCQCFLYWSISFLIWKLYLKWKPRSLYLEHRTCICKNKTKNITVIKTDEIYQ